jgi:hypothetical protein
MAQTAMLHRELGQKLYTRWGKEIAEAIAKAPGAVMPHSEYPRPQLRRESYQCLNGLWEYAIIEKGKSIPGSFDGEILVPFSPESPLSGVSRQLLPSQKLCCRRTANFDECGWSSESGKRLLLHFGAVDQECIVFVNGKEAGNHKGGYWPFTFDITEVAKAGENEISVVCTDPSDTGQGAYGKQKLRRGGIRYTAQSGIWQTVWAEAVNETYIESLKITPLYDESAVLFELTITEKDRSRKVVRRTELPGFRKWSPDDPYLYNVKISLRSESGYSDEVESYFGMRKFGVSEDIDGIPRLFLNDEPIFQSGLLDQGYWSDGLYTPPSDEAMVWELTKVKELGFNMLRKHIKIEPLRWYYHCDRLGLIVWQDFVSGGGPYNPAVTQILPFIGVKLNDKNYKLFGRNDAAGRASYFREMKDTVALLYNAVSIAVWVPFNEGWGQFNAAEVCAALKEMDKTRTVDHASGWHDRGAGDVDSRHIYYKRFNLTPDRYGRVQALTEFGGYSLVPSGHTVSKKSFGYRMYKTSEALSEAIYKLYRDEVVPAKKTGLSAAIYTQVSDVEDEVNGLFTYDREIQKIDEDVLRRINQMIYQ